MRWEDDHEWWVGDDLEGHCCGLFQRKYSEFAWTDTHNHDETSTKTVSNPVEISTRYLLNISIQGYCYTNLLLREWWQLYSASQTSQRAMISWWCDRLWTAHNSGIGILLFTTSEIALEFPQPPALQIIRGRGFSAKDNRKTVTLTVQLNQFQK
jgi:hypothetical protein